MLSPIRPYRLALILASVGALAATARAEPSSGEASRVKSEWNVADHLTIEQLVVQSHRGAGVLAEENTLPAFELAWQLGTYPEADVRVTRDGVIVAFHDHDFSRLVKDAPAELRGKGVKDLTYDELAQLDVGSWKGPQFAGRRVPRLRDVFAAMRGRPERHLYLDVKSVDLDRLAAEVKAHDVARQVVLASPRPELLREWKALVPESETLLWMRGSEAALQQRIGELRSSGFPGITQVQIHIFPNRTIEEALAIAKIRPEQIDVDLTEAKRSSQRYTVSDKFILELGRELRAHGITFQTLPYTSDPTVYAELLDLGVASFATDHPDVTMRELKRYYDQRNARLAQ
jgi:glycerophosphoryl diester phosphodiesterase